MHDSEILQILWDERQIKRLFRQYADICDEQYDVEKLRPLFTEDCTWSATSENGTSDWGTHVGRDAILEFFAGAPDEITYAHHMVISPEVEIEEPGKRASGKWNTFNVMRLENDPYTEGGDCKLMSGVYKHEYRCTDGTWQISRLDAHVRFDIRARWVG